MSKRVVKITLLVAGIAALVYATAGNPLDPFDNRQFSPHVWQNTHDSYARAEMTRDVMRRHVRRGMSEQEVIALLGQPDTRSDRRGPGGERMPGVHILQYHIGSWTARRMDDAFLYIHLDTQNRVLQSEIYGY